MPYTEPYNPDNQLIIDDVQDLLGVIQGALIKRIEERHAGLTEEDVTKVISGLSSNPDILPKKVKQALKLRQVQDMGRDPLSRILIEHFSRMLEAPEERTMKQGALPRSMLPGFLAAVRLMLGNNIFETLRVRSIETVERLMSCNDELMEPSFWKKLCLDPESQEVAQLIYCTIATHFSNYTRRKNWFLLVINDSLDLRFDPRDESEEARWRIEEAHFVEMFARIYIEDIKTLELRHTFNVTLQEHFSKDERQKVFEMLKGLQSDIKGTLSQSRMVANRPSAARR